MKKFAYFIVSLVVSAVVGVSANLIERAGEAVAEGTQRLQEEELNRRTVQAVTTIDSLIAAVRKNADALISDAGQKNIRDIVADLERKITEHMDGVHSLMKINLRSNTNISNETECGRYFVEYENLAQGILKRLDDCGKIAATSMHNSLEAAIQEATEVQRTIRAHPTSCGQECGNVGDSIDRAVADVSRKIDAVLEDYAKLVNGTTIKEVVHTQTNYILLFKSEDDLWNETLNCVTSRSSRVRKS